MHGVSFRIAARVLGALLSIACLVYFAVATHNVFTAESFSLAQSQTLGRLPAAAALFVLAYAAFAGTWHCLLRLFGLNAPVSQVFGIYLTTQIAKYLPGSIGHHVGRVYLTSKYGLPAFRVGMSIAVELMLNIPVALLLSLPLAPMVAERFSAGFQSRGLLIACVAGVATALAVAAYFMRHHHAVQSARNHLGSALQAARGRHALPYFGVASVLSTLGLVFAGLSLVALCGNLSDLAPATVAKGVALACAAWIIGSVTPGAPAGLGVRDAILLAGLGSLFDHRTALEATILFRALSVAVDLAAFLVGLLLLRGTTRRAVEA
jgi:uncharacterized membrane protein YbhN (UPF0104 family)